MTRKDRAASPPGGVLGDGGLQVERTTLSWERTECSVFVSALVGLRLTAHAGQWLVIGLVAVVACGTALLALSGVFPWAHSRVPAPRAAPIRLHLLALSTFVLGVSALLFTVWVCVTPPG